MSKMNSFFKITRANILGLVFALLAIIGVIGTNSLTNRLSLFNSVPDDAFKIKVTAHQWYWQFDYGNGIFTDELNVPVGQPVALILRSGDVIHSLSIEEYGIEEEILPGRETIVIFTPEKEGAIKATCKEFCGTGHDKMRVKVNALQPIDYQAWYANEIAERHSTVSLPYKSTSTDTSWQRSYSDDHSTRYSELKSINTSNVHNLEPIWTFSFPGNEEDVSSKINNQATPISAGGVIFTTSITGHVIGLHPLTGKEIWTKKLPNPVGKRGVTSKKFGDELIIFVPTSQGVYALKSHDGNIATQIGQKGIFPAHISVVPPIVTDKHVFVATMGKGLQAFEILSGKEIWTTLISSGDLAPRIWSGLSYDQQSELLFIVTSDPGGLIGIGRKYEIDYSSSIIAFSAKTGAIIWRFQETLKNLWDLDLAGSPIVADIEIEGVAKRSVIALSKTGNVMVLDLLTGEPLYKNSVERVHNVPKSDSVGEQTSSFQKKISIPPRISHTKVNPTTDFRINNQADADYIKIKTRRAKYEEFLPPSHNYDVVLYGLHGGANRTGGAYYKDTQSLIVPANHYPWFLRLFKSDKVYTAIKRIHRVAKMGVRFFRRIQNALGINYISTSDHKYGVIDQIYSHLPFVGRNENYKKYCAYCHGLSRQGVIQSEFRGDTYYPSLLGIAKGDKFKHLSSINSFAKVHQLVELKNLPDEAILKDIRNYITTADEFLEKHDLFKNKGRWQLFLGRDGHPATKGPWGTITSINLKTGAHNWKIPFGARLDKKGKVITEGDTNFGGVLASAGKIIFATGTTDKFARAYDADSGNLLWEDKMPLSGSTSPMTYMAAGCQIVVFTATGGIFVGFENGLGSLIAYKDKTCKFKSTP